MGVTTTQLEPGGNAGPVLPKHWSFQEKPETTKFKRYLLMFKCWQPIRIFFKYCVNQTKNIHRLDLAYEPPVFRALAFQRAQVHVGLIGIPLLSHHSVLQFLEFWGVDGAEWPVPHC